MARLVRVAQVQAVEHRLSHTAWRLWWEDGGELTPPARDLLTQVADRWEDERDRLSSLLGREEAGDAAAVAEMDDFYRQAETGRVSGAMGQARRNVGRQGFSTVMRVFAEVAAGRFAGYETTGSGGSNEHQAAPNELVERALDLDRARDDQLAKGDPWLTTSSEVDFARLSQLMGGYSFCVGAAKTDVELDQARVELRAFQTLVSTIAPLFERLFGRAAFGFGMIGRAVVAKTARTQAFMLLGWLALREDDGLREGMQRLAGVAPAAQATVRLYDLLSQLRREVPAYGPVLTDRRLAAAQFDDREAARLRADIVRVRQENEADVDAFFASRPEAREIIEIAERYPEAT
jgi:hypothetical protein